MSTVLVVGASGTTGRRVADGLAAEGADVRRGGRSGPTRFDWASPAGHDAALDGADAAYLIAPMDVADPVPLVRPVLERAVARGLRRVVLLSSSLIEEDDAGFGGLARLVRTTAPEATVLRPSWFAQNFAGEHHVARALRAGRVVTATGAGRVPFVDAGDIAAVAVRALLAPEPIDPAPVITGPRALSYDEACAIAAPILGHPVEHVDVTTDELVRYLIDAGYPEVLAGVLAGLDERIRHGAEDRVTDAVERITGRPPRAFADVLADELAPARAQDSSTSAPSRSTDACRR